MPSVARTTRSTTVAANPTSAQIIHDGKYEPRILREGDELHPVRTRTTHASAVIPTHAYRLNAIRALLPLRSVATRSSWTKRQARVGDLAPCRGDFLVHRPFSISWIARFLLNSAAPVGERSDAR